MSDFIWWVGLYVILYFFARFSAWVMRKFIFAGNAEKYKHWLEED